MDGWYSVFGDNADLFRSVEDRDLAFVLSDDGNSWLVGFEGWDFPAMFLFSHRGPPVGLSGGCRLGRGKA